MIMFNSKEIVNSIKNLYGEIDNVISVIRSKTHLPCKVGCAYCCYQYIAVCFPEAIVIIDAVRRDTKLKKYFESKIDLLKQQVKVLREPDMSNYVWFEKQLPCIFLRDGECVVYENRPLVCRAHIVVEETADGCKVQKEPPKIKIVDKGMFVREMLKQALALSNKFGISWGYRPFQLALIGAWDILEHNKKPVKLSQADEIKEMMPWARLEMR